MIFIIDKYLGKKNIALKYLHFSYNFEKYRYKISKV